MVKWVLSFLAFLASGSASATLVSIDFSGPNPGDIVTNQFSGVHISLLGGAPIAGPRISHVPDWPLT
jgi:hypothetical protein